VAMGQVERKAAGRVKGLIRNRSIRGVAGY